MNLQLDTNEYYREFSTKKHSIGMAFSNRGDKYLPYIRRYGKLNKEELLYLINVAKENSWTALDLSNCAIEELPEELWEITSLKLLYLGNWYKRDNANQFTVITQGIAKLVNLEALSISNIKNLIISDAVKKLPALVYLDCFGCDFDKIPLGLLNTRIKAIGIDCKSADQVTKLCKIKKIEELYLTGGQLDYLPDDIGYLYNLKRLIISRTNIKTIPNSMLNLKKLKAFIMDKTPLAESTPYEIIKQTPLEVIGFICKQQDAEEAFYFNESKMIVVGQGSVGKSCLVERITKNRYEEKESTEGIDVKTWTYNIKNKIYNLNIWDFGGQEIYHSTHQFFLTKRSLYVFVWDARSEEEYGRVDYWLKTIESFAADSPIIIAVNKCDKNVNRINRIDMKEYQQRYPQIKVVLDISCKDNINIERLRSHIKTEASKLPITKERWLKSWHDIREKLVRIGKQRKYISIVEYLNLCKEQKVEREEALSLSKYLHDLGIILHYQEDAFLKEIVILSPEWATAALYKILDCQETILKNRNGILFVDDLPKIWKDSNIYPEDKYTFLLRVMEKFDLCYSLDERTYLVAELLENTSIDCPKGWNLDTNCIAVNYRYDFMPAGIMTRFIVKIHPYIARENGKNLCWKKGVYLRHKSACASVIMKNSISEKIIEIKVSKMGISIDQRELLYKIRGTIRNLNESLNNLRVEEYVPCNCSSECNYMFPYKVLCDALEKHQKTIQCYNTFSYVDILDLLEGIDIMKKEDIGLYSINIQNNPVFMNQITSENTSTQNNITNIQMIKNSAMEIQGDMAELIDELNNTKDNEDDEILKLRDQVNKIQSELDEIGKFSTTEEIVRSGKLNKLKRWLINLSDDNSSERKALSGIKVAISIINGLITKYNYIAKLLGVHGI